MVATPHLLTGALLGSQRSPWLAAGLGVGSHFLLDAVPHRDYPPRPELLAADLACGLAAVALLAGRDRGAWAGALGAIAPDLATRLPATGPLHRASLAAHQRWHTGTAPSTVMAVLGQAAWSGACGLLLRRR